MNNDNYIWNCIINSNFSGLNVFFESNKLPSFTNTPPILFAVAIALFNGCDELSVYYMLNTIESHGGKVNDTICNDRYISLDGKWWNVYYPFGQYIYTKDMKVVQFIEKLLERKPQDSSRLYRFKEYILAKFTNSEDSYVITIV